MKSKCWTAEINMAFCSCCDSCCDSCDRHAASFSLAVCSSMSKSQCCVVSSLGLVYFLIVVLCCRHSSAPQHHVIFLTLYAQVELSHS